MEKKILVITPVKHIKGVTGKLESIGSVDYIDDPSPDEVSEIIANYDAIFTNPNKSKVFIGENILGPARNLKVICTASTGTNHIDKVYAKQAGIPILSLTEERQVIERISSTAELAFALMMDSLRDVTHGYHAVLQGEWDYTKHIGRQLNSLTVGSIGYGRLGTKFVTYCKAFDANVVVYDPYKKVHHDGVEQVDDLDELLSKSDVIAIHVHVTDETLGMIDKSCFAKMKSDVCLVNTSRGDIVNEPDLVEFLAQNPDAKIATDVLADEIKNRSGSPLLLYANSSKQVIITPHIGGMTREAQEIAYGHAAQLLKNYFSKPDE